MVRQSMIRAAKYAIDLYWCCIKTNKIEIWQKRKGKKLIVYLTDDDTRRKVDDNNTGSDQSDDFSDNQ